MRKNLSFTQVLEHIAAIIMLTLVFITFVQVITRYAFSQIPIWSGEETAILLLIWLANIGAVIGASRMAHISIDFVTQKLSKKGQVISEKIVYLIVCTFLAYFSYVSFQLAWGGRLSSTPRLGIPMFWIQISIFIGMILMLYFYLKHFINTFKKKSEEDKDDRIVC